MPQDLPMQDPSFGQKFNVNLSKLNNFQNLTMQNYQLKDLKMLID